MSIHVRKVGVTREMLRKLDFRSKLCSMFAGLIILGLVGVILTYWVIYTFRGEGSEFLVYVPAADKSQLQDSPTSIAPTSRSRVPTPPVEVTPSVIVAETVVPIEMEMMEVPIDEIVDAGISLAMEIDLGSDAMAGMGDSAGDAAGDASGSGSLAGNGGGLGSEVSDGSQLEGTFYDLKQKENGRYSGVSGGDASEAQVIQILRGFLERWSPRKLNDYYRAKQKLYASHFFLPVAAARYGPIAYGCEKECRPSAWVAVYRGKVKAPKSGKFRFVGTGDDTLAVRFNHQTVLVAGYSIPIRQNGPRRLRDWTEYERYLKRANDKGLKGHELVRLDGIPRWNREVGGLTAGQVFEVEQGGVYPIEILISEIPGGLFGLMLLIEDLSRDPVAGQEEIAYDLFRTNSAKPDEKYILKQLRQAGCAVGSQLEVPRYNADSPIWQVVP